MLPLSYNIRNLRVRRTTTLLSAAGIGLVTAIFATVLALAEGFRSTQAGMGDPEVAVVLREGSTSAINSLITREQVRIMSSMTELAGTDAYSPEVVIIFQLPTADGEGEANVLVRGVSATAFAVHRNVRIIAGRAIDPTRHEVMVGRAAATRYMGMRLGSTFRQAGVTWRVVGIFEAGGSGFESEIWGDDVKTMDAFKRENYSMISARLRDPGLLGAFAARVRDDRRLALLARNEVDYYAEQAEQTTGMLKGLGIFVTSILAIGAIFGAVNTMYASVGARTAEIATLRAIGFRRRDILLSFMIEAAFIGLLGGLLGCVLTIPMNGVSTAVMNFQSFSDLAFKFRVTPDILVSAVVWAILMGAVGGFFPAVRAVRLPIAAAFRDVA